MKRSEFISQFLEKCPGPVISRKQASALSGGLKSIGHLANLDSQGKGCKKRIRIGRRMGYDAAAFADWLADQVTFGLEN